MIIATIIGRIGRDAETKSIGSQQVTEFSVASNEPGKRDAKPVWVRVSMWGNKEKLAPHLTKGKLVVCSGELSVFEGQKGQFLQLRCSSFEFGGGALGSGDPAPRARPEPAPERRAQPVDDLDTEMGDIPF